MIEREATARCSLSVSVSVALAACRASVCCLPRLRLVTTLLPLRPLLRHRRPRSMRRRRLRRPLRLRRRLPLLRPRRPKSSRRCSLSSPLACSCPSTEQCSPSPISSYSLNGALNHDSSHSQILIRTFGSTVDLTFARHFDRSHSTTGEDLKL